ncbi:NAD(P)-binding protein [Macrolepiota fuliginosa MF-IS2]|uniref:NAD(P)-binding protein n=1 Tax=Macrolepiota fuliginosa MF-IS2 TaxID=1400762 RepID=A0A9P5XFN9_9AGAR|nr:NAD(P)-binding protein [Macrolepiota fuliginosa MF-IS2]
MTKVVLVTGGNAGIGFELSKSIAQKGHKVWLAARNPVSGEEAVAKLKQEGLNVKSVRLDVTDLASIIAAKEVIEKEDGKVDVLVNNAGVGLIDQDQNALTVDLKIIRECFEANFYGLIQTTQTFAPLIEAAASATGYAVILNVSSDMASNTYQARPGSQLHVVAYNTSKAAANSYTIALAHELKKQNIKVNAVTPGYTSTKLNSFGQGAKDVTSSARILLPWALLDKDGPTGLFIQEDGKEMPW